MIEMFNDVPMRDSGIIYNSVFEQIKKLYSVDPEKAGELAISAIELTLTGQVSSDDMMVDLMLEPTKISVGRNQAKYDQKVENSKSKKIAEQKLEQIADLSLKGYKQREIAERLVPLTSVLYLLLCIGVLVVCYRQIPTALRRIMEGAFSPKAVTGGVIGSALAVTALVWTKRRSAV